MRSVVGDNNSEFYDIDRHITHRKISKSKAEAIVLGDDHALFACPDVREATFGKGGIVEVTRPKYIVRHDLIDSYSISHHHRNHPSVGFKKHITGLNKLEDELELTARYLEDTTPKGSISVVVPSNHHDHIMRWMETVEWRTELWNARIYHELWVEWLSAIEKEKEWSPFIWWMKKNCSANALYLREDYPFIIKDIYLGYHGHRGSDGARGNIKGFAKIGAKTITGHTHSPEVDKGAYRVGTSSQLRLDYTKGASSWLGSHCLIHPNGKRQIVHIIYGDWRYN
jgi:hypothetical protein